MMLIYKTSKTKQKFKSISVNFGRAVKHDWEFFINS